MAEIISEPVVETSQLPDDVENEGQEVPEVSDPSDEPRTVPDATIAVDKNSKGSLAKLENTTTEDQEKQAPVDTDPAASLHEENQIEHLEEQEEETMKESGSIEEYYKMVKSLLSADPATLPPSYTKNSEKEEKVIDFVENFLRQYKQLFPNRKELFILPGNEWNVKVRSAVSTVSIS